MQLTNLAIIIGETKLLAATFSIFILLAILIFLLTLLKRMINEQIALQMKKIIPIRPLRKLVGVKIKWK